MIEARRRGPMLVLGVTGDVGAGKSTVSQIWKSLGATIIDADALAHEAWKDTTVLRRASERWGTQVLLGNGHINPSVVASIVFSDMTEYEWVCDMIHPFVRIEMERKVASLQGWVIAEIPLLFENRIPWWVDLSVYVTAPLDLRLARNEVRGWNKEEIERRERFLRNAEEKRAEADLVIRNDSSIDTLEQSLSRYAALFKKMAALCEIRGYSSDELVIRKAAIRLGASGQVTRIEIVPLTNALVRGGSLSMNKRYMMRAYSCEFYWAFVERTLTEEGLEETELISIRRLSRSLRNELVEEIIG
jgi:dephospho-CoA kinase